MPKQADIRVQVPCCTAAHFWNVIYERPEATERYHTSFNASTATSATPWESCQRTVNFTMPLKLPDFLKRMVGLDSVAVTEVQRVMWHGGGAFTVSSETNITNMMGAGRFTTVLQLSVTEQQHQQQLPADSSAPPAATSPSDAATGTQAWGGSSGGSCAGSLVQLVYSVRCAASSMPWPMSATIENVMSEKALVSMQSFLDFCTQLLEEQAMATAAAAAAALAGAPPAAAGGSAASQVDAATASMSAAAAATTGLLLEPSVRLSDSGAATGGAPPLLSPGLPTRASMRHRWPSITCSQEIGGMGVGPPGVGVPGPAGDSFMLRRQETAGTQGGDMFWDAPEAFGAAGCGSGVSSGAVSPRQLLLQSGSLRRPSGDCGTGAATNGGAATAAAAAGPVAASAVAVSAVAIETHQVAVAVDRLTAAVASLDGKVDKLLLLQDQQQLQQLQDLQHNHQHDHQQQQLQNPPDYLLDHPTASASRRGSGGSDADGRSDVRWMFRVTLAVLLATLLVMAYWVLHPYATGFGPHGGGGTPPVSMPLVSVLRLDGGAAAADSLGGSGGGGRLRGGGGASGDGGGLSGGGSGGGVVEGIPRLMLQILGLKDGGGGSKGAEFHGGEDGAAAHARRRRRRQRQKP